MIQVEQLSKYYGARAAIRNLSFRIEAGEVVGFLGLNGAGKTTTLRILGCVLLPTSGTVRLDGQDLLTAPRQLKARIGFLPETPPLYEDMTVGEYLAFVAGLRAVDAGRIRARVTETEERTGLAALDDERISTLSHGYRQRVGVAQALVHAPDVLLLDEPANGLDPVQNVEMRALIRSLRGDHTVLVSSHILPEIAQTCDRLLVVRDGELVAQGSEAELEERLGVGTGIELEIAGPVEASGRRAPRRAGGACRHRAAGGGRPLAAPGGRSGRAPPRAGPGGARRRCPALPDGRVGGPAGVVVPQARRKGSGGVSPVLLIARRELRGYLRTMTGWIIAASVLLIDGLLFNAFALEGSRRSTEVLTRFFYFASGPTMVAAVFLAMRLLAEERQLGTLPLLYASPVRDRDIALGKFLGALAFLSGVTLATVYMPLLILVHGHISVGHLLAGYLGLLLLGAASLGLGTLGSSLARSRIVAVILGAALLVSLLVAWLLASVTEPPFSGLFAALALHNAHFPPFQSGQVHLRDVAYYLLVTWVALFATTRVLEARRWR